MGAAERQRIVGRDDAGLELVRRRILFGQPRCDGGYRRARLRNADARRQAAVEVDPLVVSIGTDLVVQRLLSRGDADAVRAERRVPAMKNEMTVESLRRDTDHDMWNAIQRERLADDLRIGAQTGSARTRIPESRRVRRCDGVVHRVVESRSPRQRHADGFEVVRRDKHRRHGLSSRRPAASRIVVLALSVRPTGDSSRPDVGGAQVHEVRIGPASAGRARATATS